MKKISILTLMVILSAGAVSQVTFQEHNVGFGEDSKSLCAVDIDGDGDLDVVSGKYDILRWWENLNGLGNFTFAGNIAIFLEYDINSLDTADFDNDGDNDVLWATDHRVVWGENTDPYMNQWFANWIVTSTYEPRTAKAGDVDGDGDIDVLIATKYENKVSWCENTDGLGTFGPQQDICIDVLEAEMIYPIDMDGDNDLDVISVALSKIAWHENFGNGDFGDPITNQHIISTNVSGAKSVYTADLDGDGDPDVLSASNDDNKIAWYENTDGLGTFGSQQIITTDAFGAWSVCATDLDKDGDYDVVAASGVFYPPPPAKVSWYENLDGLGSFGPEQNISDRPERGMNTMVIPADIDGDSDMDILANLGLPTAEMVWFENLSPLGMEDPSFSNQTVYPNPTDGMLYIQGNTPISRLELYTLYGQLVRTTTHSNSLDISSFSSGIYFLKIIADTNDYKIQKVLKQ